MITLVNLTLQAVRELGRALFKLLVKLAVLAIVGWAVWHFWLRNFLG